MSNYVYLEECLVKHCVDAKEKNNSLECAVMSYQDYTELIIALGSKVQFIICHEDGQDFEGCRITTPVGPLSIFPDFNIKNNEVAFFGNKSVPVSPYKVFKNDKKLKDFSN